MAEHSAGNFIKAVLLLLLLAACSHADRSQSVSGDGATGAGRDPYNPNVRNDPYVKAQWEASVKALENECARSARYCAEASKAREAIKR